MWGRNFDERLAAWIALRRQIVDSSPLAALETINAWWFRSPWTPYYLHWDDQDTWPDPWQLLEENIFCPLARALGMLYTVAMLDRSDFRDAELLEIQNHNLVLIQNKKYILNWDPEQIVNIELVAAPCTRRLTPQQILHRIN
jgi:hypothetical protein